MSPHHAHGQTERARRAVLAVFLAQGVAIGSWVAQIPVIKEQFGLSDAELGLTLFAIAAGSVISLLTTGPLVCLIFRYASALSLNSVGRPWMPLSLLTAFS